MSLTPLTEKEKNFLHELFQKKGFNNNLKPTNNFRYSILDSNVIIITVKKPIEIPVRLNIPFEVLAFKLSLSFMIRATDFSTLENLNYLIDRLREIGIESNLEHEFPIEGKENELLNILNQLIPEAIKNELEPKWVNRIRISILNKQPKFAHNNKILSSNVNNSIKELGLEATNDLPWDTKNGIPKFRINNILFFKNADSNNEYLILEKGFLTYFNEILIKNTHVRSYWDSYTPYLLLELYKEESFNLEFLITTWIKFSRLILNSIIKLIESEEINKLNFLPCNFKRIALSSEEDLSYCLIPLNYESKIAKKLYPVEYKLLGKPPSDFEEINSIELYQQALDKYITYKFSESIQLFVESMKIFNKFKQTKIVILILLHLSKIAKILKQPEKTLEYLKNALDLCKHGNIPLPLIIKLHKKLGKTYTFFNHFDKAKTHFNIIISFIESNKTSINDQEILANTYLNLAKINLKSDNLSEAKMFFNKALKTAKGSLKIKLGYYYERAKYNKKTEKISLAIKLLKEALSLPGLDEKTIRQYKKRILKINKELAKIFIYYRKDEKNALIVLNNIKKLITKDSIFNLKMMLTFYQMMADFHKIILKDENMSNYFLDQVLDIKNQLNVIGVPI